MKKIKKFISFMLVGILIASLVVGCSKNEVEDNDTVEDESISEEVDNKSTDVVVVGAGGAGLSAALEIKAGGKDVIVIEKMSMVGGNTLRATGGINAAGTSVQETLGIEDDEDIHYEDTIEGGYEKNDPTLVKAMTTKATDAVEWLIGIGADLSDVGRLGGATNDRAHRPTGGAAVGAHIVKVLKENAEKEDIEILLETRATDILYKDGQIKGVAIEDKEGNEFTIEAKAVILATGGFGANADMISDLDSSLEGFGTTNHPGATGDGIVMATDIGADTVQMEEIQTHPTVVPSNGFMITEAVRGNGAILINREGKRFINEISTRDVVSEAILEQEKQTAYLLFDGTIKDSLKAIDEYISMGLTTEGETIEDLATELEIDPNILVETINIYNTYVDEGSDKDFDRPDMPRNLEKGNYYAIEIGPAVHHTMGGLSINEKAQVLNGEGEAIPGLYAAGEVTGGVHGGNRLGGNALADIVVFGRIAGQTTLEEM